MEYTGDQLEECFAGRAAVINYNGYDYEVIKRADGTYEVSVFKQSRRFGTRYRQTITSERKRKALIKRAQEAWK